MCVVVALVVLLGACGRGGGDAASDASSTSASSASTGPSDLPAPLPEPVQELEFDANEYSFKISPDPSAGLKPGWTLVRFHNVGVEPHQVMFARIKDGVDMSQLAAAGAGDSSGAGAIEFVDMIGGVSYIGPGHDTTAMVNLTEGLVMAMCYVPDANGVAHALMGMTSALTVSKSSDDARSSGPEATGEPEPSGEVLGTIELSADDYRIPDDLRTGWYHVENNDTVLHEMSLLRLARPITADQTAVLVEDLAANESPQVGLEAVGGMGAISAGFDGYLYLDLAPGDYLAVDFMPDTGESSVRTCSTATTARSSSSAQRSSRSSRRAFASSFAAKSASPKLGSVVWSHPAKLVPPTNRSVPNVSISAPSAFGPPTCASHQRRARRASIVPS